MDKSKLMKIAAVVLLLVGVGLIAWFMLGGSGGSGEFVPPTESPRGR